MAPNEPQAANDTSRPGSTKTAVADMRAEPLGSLSRTTVRRIVPDGGTPKPPVAAFDSAL